MQRKTDRQGCRADNRNQTGGLDAKLRQHRQQRNGKDKIPRDRAEKAAQHFVDVAGSLQSAPNQIIRAPGDPKADNENDNGADHVQRIVQHKGNNERGVGGKVTDA
nr:hypothetical protein [Acidisphaera sp. S103]